VTDEIEAQLVVVAEITRIEHHLAFDLAAGLFDG
jgi:hypothetical protein